MRRLIYYVAVSLDGFIALEDGSLDGFIWDEKYGADLRSRFPETFPAHLQSETMGRRQNKRFDAVLMGRKTYEVGVREGITNPYPTLDQYLFSRTISEKPDKGIVLVSDDAEGVVNRLKQETGKDIWLCGGSELASTLLDADLIDGLTVKLNPVVFGTGIPLFSGRSKPRNLELTDSKAYRSGHLLLQYRVIR